MLISGYASVIVPVHNAALTLRDCLEAIAAQTYRPLELVVVDDGSTDPTPAWLRAFRAAHPELRVVSVSQPRAGTGAALAAGAAVARGEFLAFAHQGDRWEPGKLARQIAALQHADFVVEDVRQEVGGVATILRAPRLGRALPCDPVCLSGLAVRRRKLEAVGGFDPAPGPAAAHEALLRLARAGQGKRLVAPLALCRRPAASNAAAGVAASFERLALTGKLDAAEARRGQARAHASAGWRALFADEPRRAAESFRAALALDRGRPEAWLGLACATLDRALFATGMLRQAES